jgi:glycosyltransferase involved in cell wall biosynthesis
MINIFRPDRKIYINGRFLTQKITGVQRYAYEISKKIIEYRNDIVFITPASSSFNPVYTTSKWNIEKAGRYNGHLWEQVELPRFLKKKHNPLLINFCSTAPLFYSNQIVTIHDLAFRHGKWHSSAFRAFYNFLLPKLSKKANHIVTVSEFSKRDITSSYNINSNKITVIYGAVFEQENFREAASDEFKKTVLSQKYILSVGSIDPRKNIKRTIEAYLSLENTKDTQLFLIGSFNRSFRADGSLNKLIEQNKDKVKLLGYRSDGELEFLYKNAAFFIYPSLFEGFGLPPLEAMSNGCPVLVSNITSLPEICGNAAVYCDPYDAEDIKNKMNYLLSLNDNENNSMKIRSFQQASMFSYTKSAEKLSEIIDMFI